MIASVSSLVLWEEVEEYPSLSPFPFPFPFPVRRSSPFEVDGGERWLLLGILESGGLHAGGPVFLSDSGGALSLRSYTFAESSSSSSSMSLSCLRRSPQSSCWRLLLPAPLPGGPYALDMSPRGRAKVWGARVFACEELMKSRLLGNQIGRRALLCLNEERLNDTFWDLERAFPEVMASCSSHILESF